MNIEQAKKIRMVDFLAQLGYMPSRTSMKRYSYCSPLREERDPSFHVDIKSNTWHDFGAPQKHCGGDILDFVREFAHLEDTSSALKWLAEKEHEATPMPMTINCQQTLSNNIVQKISYTVLPLAYQPLLEYLANRGITRDVATRYCKEIWYKDHDDQVKPYFGVAFPTRSESYEFRNKKFKRCFGHKDISHIKICADKPTTECCVFEGFIDFLSYVMLFRRKHSMAQLVLCDCIVLISINNLRKALPLLGEYSVIHCYLDNDEPGKNTTMTINAAYPRATIDESPRYALANDVNDYLIAILGLKKEKEPCDQ